MELFRCIKRNGFIEDSSSKSETFIHPEQQATIQWNMENVGVLCGIYHDLNDSTLREHNFSTESYRRYLKCLRLPGNKFIACN